MKNPHKVLLPSRNLILVALRVEKSGGRVSFTPLDNLPLDLSYGSAIETLVSGVVRGGFLSDSRGQLSDCPKYRSAEFFQSPPIHSPVESLTYFTASPPKVDVILIVGHRVLYNVSRKFVFAEIEESYSNHR